MAGSPRAPELPQRSSKAALELPPAPQVTRPRLATRLQRFALLGMEHGKHQKHAIGGPMIIRNLTMALLITFVLGASLVLHIRENARNIAVVR
jgi:hypothetical protein